MSQQSLLSRLDSLSSAHRKSRGLPFKTRYFTQQISSEWLRQLIPTLCNEFKTIESDSDREQWLKGMFMELLQSVYGYPHTDVQQQKQQGEEELDSIYRDIGILINELTKTPATQSKTLTTSIVGKVFIAVAASIPTLQRDNSILLPIMRSATLIHPEVYRFSWISAKLLSRQETQLLKHLLKKSKYELKKYNLLAENAVGWSQLVMLFYSAYNDVDRMVKVDYYVEESYHIAGKYSLDPMRFFEVFLVISSRCTTYYYRFMVEFLRRSKLVNMVAGNNRNNNGDDDGAINIDNSSKNRSIEVILATIVAFHLNKRDLRDNIDTEFLDMCAILAKFGMLDVKLVWENLTPDTETLEKFISDTEMRLESEARKGADNPLAMADALTAGDDDNDSSDFDDGGNSQRGGRSMAGDEVELTNGRDGNALNKLSEADFKRTQEELERQREEKEKEERGKIANQSKILFLKSLLVHGCLEDAQHIIHSHPNIVLVDDSIPLLVSRIYEYIITPLYEERKIQMSSKITGALTLTFVEDDSVNRKPLLFDEYKTRDPFASTELNTKLVFYFSEWTDGIQQAHTLEDLFRWAHFFYSLVGPDIVGNPTLPSKLCRIITHEVQNSPSDIEKWINFFRKFMFGTLALSNCDEVLSMELFGVMKLFPFEKRFFLYNDMITKVSQDFLLTRLGSAIAEREVRHILKALSTDTIEKESRRLARLISSNPMATLIPVVIQIENYDKVSELVVYSMKYFSEFAHDVLQYVLLLRLSTPRTVVQADGVNQAMWIQRLSVFIASVAKNSTQMDLSKIIVYIIKTLHQGNIKAISILKELLVTVAGIRDLNEVNVTSLTMLNSGRPLKKLARKLIFDTRDANAELAATLLSMFTSEGSVSEIILLLYRLNLEANTKENSHYKILSSRCDELNSLLWSFVELIKFCFTPKEFAANVLPLSVLSNKFNMSTPWVFHIWREYMDQKDRELEETSGITPSLGVDDEMLSQAEFCDINFADISRELFIAFWKLSLYDIHFEKPLYDKQKLALESELNHMPTTSNRKRGIISNQIKEILVTCIAHQRTMNQITSALTEKVQGWCESFTQPKIDAFLKYCVVPRALFSPSDALYSAYFIFQAFSMEHIMAIFGRLVRSEILGTLLFSSTISEAGNLGIFFAAFLDGFEAMRRKEDLSSAQKRTLYEWHTVINDQVIYLLSAKSYMSIRNGIEFMKHVSAVFPVVDNHIELLLLVLEQNLVGEEREDIRLPSNSLVGHLMARLKKEAIKLSDFCELTEEEKTMRDQREAEMEEIRSYEMQLANENKQAELRKKLEENKRRREEGINTGDKATRTASNPPYVDAPLTSASVMPVNATEKEFRWPLQKVFKYMDEMVYLLKNNEIARVTDLITNEDDAAEYRAALNASLPLREFRDLIYKILERFFYSLVIHPRNPDFKKRIDSLKSSVNYVNRGPIDNRGDMYSEVGDVREVNKHSSKKASMPGSVSTTSVGSTPPLPTVTTTSTDGAKRISRYNVDSTTQGRLNDEGKSPHNIPREPSGMAEGQKDSVGSFKRDRPAVVTKTVNNGVQESGREPGISKQDDSNPTMRSRDSRVPQRTAVPQGPQGGRMRRQDRAPMQRTTTPVLPRHPTGAKREATPSQEDRASKRFKVESSEFKRQQPPYSHPQVQQRQEYWRREVRGGNINERSRFNSSSGSERGPPPKREGGTPNLPHGPKGSSRYQR